MSMGECFFWYRLTRVVPDRIHRAVKRLCVCDFIAVPLNICEKNCARKWVGHSVLLIFAFACMM